MLLTQSTESMSTDDNAKQDPNSGFLFLEHKMIQIGMWNDYCSASYRCFIFCQNEDDIALAAWLESVERDLQLFEQV